MGLVETVNNYRIEPIEKKRRRILRIRSPIRQVSLENISYKRIGKESMDQYFETKDISFAVKAYNERTIEAKKRTNPKHVAYLYDYSGNPAWYIYHQIKNQVWAEKNYHAKIRAAKLYEGFNVRRAIFSYKDAARAARILSKKGVYWDKKCAEACKEAIRLDPKEISELSVVLGDANFRIYIKTKKKSFAKKAIRNYSKGLKYLESKRRISAIKSHIFSLSGSLKNHDSRNP
jgi:hypothetical protein